jgi:hypothetical protein
MTPPDGSLAAGPKQLLAAANSVVQARTLAGTALLTVPIRSFWGFKDTDPVDIVHPRVAYDAGTGHFYFASNLVVHVPVQEDVNGQTETVIIDVTAVLLAVSVGRIRLPHVAREGGPRAPHPPGTPRGAAGGHLLGAAGALRHDGARL